MQETTSHKILESLKICIDSLVWIGNNSINDAIKIRAINTIKEVSKITENLINVK